MAAINMILNRELPTDIVRDYHQTHLDLFMKNRYDIGHLELHRMAQDIRIREILNQLSSMQKAFNKTTQDLNDVRHKLDMMGRGVAEARRKQSERMD